MNRRIFLCSVVGSAFANSSVTVAKDTGIKIAFMGGSHSHARDKVKVVQQSPHYELVGLFEEDLQLRKFYQEAGVKWLSRDQILNDKSIQAVAVESAVKDHSTDARQVLQAGKHVHVEKPPADDLNAFKTLVAEADKRQLLVQIGYMWRYNPGIKTALEAARQGWLGKVYLIRAMMNTLISPDRRPEWGQFRGGQMFEQGSHLVDPMVRLMGRPLRVTSTLKRHGPFEDSLMDNTVAILEWESALGVITSATLQPGAGPHRSLEIFGSNGTAVVRPIEAPVLQIDLAKPAGQYQSKSQQVPLPPYRRYVDDFDELAVAIRSHKRLSVSPNEELVIQETLLRASEML